MRKSLISIAFFLLFFSCVKFYALSPFYVLSDIFYFMPKSTFDDCDGKCSGGMVWFPVTRIQHSFDCG